MHRRVARFRTATNNGGHDDEWDWEQEAKCVSHNTSEAPGPRMGGATWVTGGGVPATNDAAEKAWMFGGVGFRRIGLFGDIDKCLLDPLVATGNPATGLCDLWSYHGSSWHKYANELLGACSAAVAVSPFEEQSDKCH